MAYQELKESLEKLLTEDMNNRSSIQEMRRNVFLSSESNSRHQEEIQQRENSIKELSTLIDSKKNLNTTLQAKISSLTEELTDERESHHATVENFESRLQLKNKEIELVKLTLEEKSNENSSLTALMLQNEEYAGKIRELIYHIDEMNATSELLQQEVKSNEFEAEVLNEKIEMLNTTLTSYKEKEGTSIEETNGLQEKISLQDNQIESFRLLLESTKNENETLRTELSKTNELTEIVAGWKADKEIVDNDNADLIAQTELLTYENGNLLFELNELKNQISQLNSTVSETELKFSVLKDAMEIERTELSSELLKLKEETSNYELEAQDKVSLLTDELRLLMTNHENYQDQSKSQLTELKGRYEVLAFEKNELIVKLENLSSQLQSTADVATADSSATENEEFIERLFKQIDGLNEEKRILAESTDVALEEISFLKNKLEGLSELLDKQPFESSHLEESNNPSKLAEAVLFSNEEKAAMNLKINELVREIDRCLALLNV